MVFPHFPVHSNHADPQAFSCPLASHSEKAEKKSELSHELMNYSIEWGEKSIEKETIYKGN